MPFKGKEKLIVSLVEEVLGQKAEVNKKFDFFINKHSEENFLHNYSLIDDIFSLLNGDAHKSKEKSVKFLECDAYFKGTYNFIFEFDELQHFTSYRLISLNQYTSTIKINFDIDFWKLQCVNYKHKADRYREKKATKDFPFIGGRAAQRAYLDCFRDLLPEVNKLNPTVRICEFEVIDIHDFSTVNLLKIEKLLKEKLE